MFTPVSTILGETVARRTTWEFAEYVILAVTMMTNMITEFLYSRFFVYKDSMNTNAAARKERETENAR